MATKTQSIRVYDPDEVTVFVNGTQLGIFPTTVEGITATGYITIEVRQKAKRRKPGKRKARR